MGNYQDFHTATRFFSVDAGFVHNEIPVHASQPVPFPRPLSASAVSLETPLSRAFLDPSRRSSSRPPTRASIRAPGTATPPIAASSLSSSRLVGARAPTRTPSQSSTQTSASASVLSGPPLQPQSHFAVVAPDVRSYTIIRKHGERPVENGPRHGSVGFGVHGSDLRAPVMRRLPSIRHGISSTTAAWQPRPASAQPYGNVYTMQGPRAHSFPQRSAYTEDLSPGLLLQQRDSQMIHLGFDTDLSEVNRAITQGSGSQDAALAAWRRLSSDQMDDWRSESPSQAQPSVEAETLDLPPHREALANLDTNHSIDCIVPKYRGRISTNSVHNDQSCGPTTASNDLPSQGGPVNQEIHDFSDSSDDHATGVPISKLSGVTRKSMSRKRPASKQAMVPTSSKKLRSRKKADTGLAKAASSGEAVKKPAHPLGAVAPVPDGQAGGQQAGPELATASCTQCRVKKLKCDRVLPMCGNCTKAGRGACLHSKLHMPATPKPTQLDSLHSENAVTMTAIAPQNESVTATMSAQGCITRGRAKLPNTGTTSVPHLDSPGFGHRRASGCPELSFKDAGIQIGGNIEEYWRWTQTFIRVREAENCHQDETARTLSGSKPGSLDHRTKLIKVARASLDLERDIRCLWLESR